MKIDIGNGYFLCGDSECMWISKRKQSKIAETEVRYMAKRLGRELDGEVK